MRRFMGNYTKSSISQHFVIWRLNVVTNISFWNYLTFKKEQMIVPDCRNVKVKKNFLDIDNKSECYLINTIRAFELLKDDKCCECTHSFLK